MMRDSNGDAFYGLFGMRVYVPDVPDDDPIVDQILRTLRGRLKEDKLPKELIMTTTVKVTAHCPADTQVKFGTTSVAEIMAGDPLKLQDVTVLQDGESAEKYVHDDRIAVVLEQKK